MSCLKCVDASGNDYCLIFTCMLNLNKLHYLDIESDSPVRGDCKWQPNSQTLLMFLLQKGNLNKSFSLLFPLLRFQGNINTVSSWTYNLLKESWRDELILIRLTPPSNHSPAWMLQLVYFFLSKYMFIFTTWVGAIHLILSTSTLYKKSLLVLNWRGSILNLIFSWCSNRHMTLERVLRMGCNHGIAGERKHGQKRCNLFLIWN